MGLGAAARVARNEIDNDHKHVEELSNRFLGNLRKNLSHLVINGDEKQRYIGNLNISFSCVEGESLIMAIKDCAVSSGSACTSASLEPSYVLRAIGVEEDMAHTSIRFGIGRFTTEEEVDYMVDILTTQVNRLRDLSPLWDMLNEGVDLKSIQWTHH